MDMCMNETRRQQPHLQKAGLKTEHTLNNCPTTLRSDMFPGTASHDVPCPPVFRLLTPELYQRVQFMTVRPPDRMPAMQPHNVKTPCAAMQPR